MGDGGRSARVAAYAVLATLCAAASACDGASREAASVVTAVERYRRAENAEKPAMATALAAVPCSDAEVCAAKTACVGASEPTARGLTLKAEVEAGLAALKAGTLAPDAPAARELPEKLEEASRLLDRGHAALEACDAKVLALKLKYRV